jgi:hypothetical protein
MRVTGALVIIAAVLAACAPKGDPAGAPTPGSGAGAKLLTRSDVPGAGWQAVPVPGGLGWSFALADCPVYDAADYPAQTHRRAVQAASYTQGHGRTIQIMIEVYAEPHSAAAVDDVRKVIEACPRYQTEQALTSHTIAAEAYAGDESLLIRSDVIRGADPAVEWWTAVIRQGGQVATVTGTNMTASEVKRVATTQARRL